MKPTDESAATVPPLLAEGLDVVFVGYNPGRYSARSGHHFAGPGNYFWPLLHDAGFTGALLGPEQDSELLWWGIGIANLVDRVTPSAADLAPQELKAGAARLRGLMARYRPRAVCFLGKDLYRYWAGWSAATPVAWGPQPSPRIDGIVEFVAPNPSRRSTVPYGVRLAWFRRLRGMLPAHDRSGRPAPPPGLV
jgi:mismatch-specific thymine-DNA glycosylase